MHNALSSAAPFPVTTVSRLGGGTLTLGKPETADWQLIFVYRGLHCPICRGYMEDLELRLSEFAEIGIEVVIVSADPVEKAEKLRADHAPTVPIGFDLSIAQMKMLGLYVSAPPHPAGDRPALCRTGSVPGQPGGPSAYGRHLQRALPAAGTGQVARADQVRAGQ